MLIGVENTIRIYRKWYIGSQLTGDTQKSESSAKHQVFTEFYTLYHIGGVELEQLFIIHHNL
nr:MAG TPA: hypothetical protein [Caudoviricetes sp.]